MPRNPDPNAELLRQTQDPIDGLGLSELQALAARITSHTGALPPVYPPRPDLRRPPLAQPAVYRIRIDLDGARPPIWRRLDFRSDLALDTVHQVIQAAFGWYDYHLHRFALGDDPFSPTSQLFLCPYDVEEADPFDEGLPATEVRLDEALQQPGDVLRYVYDYGDSWHLTLRLEELLPTADDTPAAVAVDGRRAAPPEDCGGVTDAEGLAEILDDPAHFDLDDISQELRAPHFALAEQGIDPRLADLIYRLTTSTVGEDITTRAAALLTPPPPLDADALAAALTAHRWFLDRAADGGIQLTSAGYLTPADVEAACQVLPAVRWWIGSHNREAQTYPLLEFRESLQHLGLLRKYKGRLLLTRVGAAAHRDPALLWHHLAERLIPATDARYDLEATLLLLFYTATSAGGQLPRRRITAALTELDWHRTDGRALSEYEPHQLDAWTTLTNIAAPTDLAGMAAKDKDGRTWVSPAAAALAAEALR